MSEQEKSNLENCDCHDVLRFEDEVCMVANLEAQSHSFFEIYSTKFVEHLQNSLKINVYSNDRTLNYEKWFENGKECEILKQGQEWQTCKVKLKLKIEVVPYDPDSEDSE